MTNRDTIQTVEDLTASTKGTLLPKEVAAVLGVDRRTVYAAMEEGQLPSVTVGKLRLVPKKAVLDLLMLDVA
jgi:excisionase family DNA binding protein